MSEADRTRWNERYAGGDFSRDPVPRLIELQDHLRPATPGEAWALDLACGAGRNTIFLACLGYTVDAWDVSQVGLSYLQEEAAVQGLASRIHTRQIDLDTALLPVAHYVLVIDTYFLDRRLLPAIGAAVKRGGLLFIETLLSTPQKPGRPDFYLQPGELRHAFPGFAELAYHENEEEGWASLLARKPAKS